MILRLQPKTGSTSDAIEQSSPKRCYMMRLNNSVSIAIFKPPPTLPEMTNDLSAGNIVTIRILATLEAALGMVVLWGWAFDIMAFKSVLPGLPTLKVNAAICFMLCGFSLGLYATNKPSTLALYACALLSVLVILIGGATLLEYAFDWNAGIDRLFFDEPPGLSFTASPGRMAIVAAALFVARGTALLLMVMRRYDLFVQWLSLLSGAIALLPILGYMFGDPLFPRIGYSSGISAHAALGLLVLSIGILLATVDRGFMLRLRPKLKTIGLVLSVVLLMLSITAILYNNHESRKATSRLLQTYQRLNLLERLQSDWFAYLASRGGNQTESSNQLHLNILVKLQQLQALDAVSAQSNLDRRSSLLTAFLASSEGRGASELGSLHHQVLTILQETGTVELALLENQKKAGELKQATLQAVMFFTLTLAFGILVFVINAMLREIYLREKAQRYEHSRSQVL